MDIYIYVYIHIALELYIIGELLFEHNKIISLGTGHTFNVHCC